MPGWWPLTGPAGYAGWRHWQGGVGDGKTVPAAANDGIPVKNDLVLAIKRVNVADCALNVDAALPAGFQNTSLGTALVFHVKKSPFQQPLPGVDNSVVNVTSSVGKTTKVKQKVNDLRVVAALGGLAGYAIAAAATDDGTGPFDLIPMSDAEAKRTIATVR